MESGIAVAAGAGYDLTWRGFRSSARLRHVARASNTREALEQIVEAELRRLVQDGVTEAEAARSIRQTTAGAMLALDGLGAAPRMLGGALAIGLPMEDVEHWPEKSRKTTEQVNEAARAVLVNPLTTAGWLLPA